MGTARGLPMPMPTMALMVLATAMAVLATDTARGPLMLMPTMALMVLAMAMAVLATDTARGPLMLTTEAMAMVVLATAMALMAMASNSSPWKKNRQPNTRAKKSSFPNSNLDLNLYLGKLNCYNELKKIKFPVVHEFLSV